MLSPAVSLVPAQPAHAAALAGFVTHNLDHLRAFLPAVAALATEADAAIYLHAATEWAAQGDVLEWYLFDGDVLCGSIRVKDIDPFDRKAKIGYFLGREYEGRGMMTASMRAVLGHCFNTLQLNRIELRCAATNVPSMAVAQRLGFTREGTLRQDEWLNGAFVDQCVYGLLRAEFLGAGAQGGNVKLSPHTSSNTP
jgi:ribosomal-protein-serine acetyltransferase